MKTGVEVQQASADFDVNGKHYPSGSYVVLTAQAFRPQVLDMFEPQDHPNDFPYPGGPPNRPYDTTGWTLAFQMGVHFDRYTESFTGPFAPHIFPTGPNGFLTYQSPGVYLNAATADPLTTAYYHAIDPAGTKTAAGNNGDFATWKELNGFNRPGVTRASYQNLYDLGFGRDMYMQTGGHTGSCAACVAPGLSNTAT